MEKYWFHRKKGQEFRLIGLLILIFNGTLYAETHHCSPLQVLSFNIRYGDRGFQSYFDENGWLNRENPRRDRVINTIQHQNPDILGLQEVLDFQLSDLKQNLPEFDFWGVGRDDGRSKGEAVPIAFRQDRFEIEKSGHFWLSETPEIPGTVFAGSAARRMVSWLRLFDLQCQSSLLVINSHWDHVSQESRVKSAELIREFISEFPSDLPLLVLGDFNAMESNEALQILRGSKGHPDTLVDGYRVLNPRPSLDEATFHQFSGETYGVRIDFILNNKAFQPLAAGIDRSSVAGLYPSDHFPVWVRLQLKPTEP